MSTFYQPFSGRIIHSLWGKLKSLYKIKVLGSNKYIEANSKRKIYKRRISNNSNNQEMGTEEFEWFYF